MIPVEAMSVDVLIFVAVCCTVFNVVFVIVPDVMPVLTMFVTVLLVMSAFRIVAPPVTLSDPAVRPTWKKDAPVALIVPVVIPVEAPNVPITSRVYPGEVVWIPMFPALLIRICSALTV